MSINDPFFAENWNKYCKFYHFLQTFHLTIITIASKINIIKVAVNTTCGICKMNKSKKNVILQNNKCFFSLYERK